MLLETSRGIKGFGRYTLHNMNNKGADQTAWMRRLVCAFVVRKPDFVNQIDGSNRPLKQIFNNYKIKSSRFCLKIYCSPVRNVITSKDVCLFLSCLNEKIKYFVQTKIFLKLPKICRLIEK